MMISILMIVIHHWQAIVSYATYQGGKDEIPDAGVLNFKFQVSLNPDRFGMAESEEAKMTNNVDCFFVRCVDEDGDVISTSDSTLPIRFMGSPIVCKLRNADDQVMIGFSTYTYAVVTNHDNTKNVSVVNGTLVKFSSDLDDFFDIIINT
ncbi:GSCOCG00007320001-RA-CDS [Cotesia congregata]|uniref:Uncharacterized protein n=1 Tax=Cotesia congregata TaxID=51543 RepID=A0A8J2EKY1_COTCN|nr:GSCOCG00007320001-RA-CDS [Cotesia congregata]CAG5076068.1 Protein of unknown function [Cotesia congregata]